jgi:alpha-mannosidase
VVSLDAGSRQLRYDVTCDWREFGSTEAGVPNLHFYLPLSYAGKFRFDVPFGVTARDPADMDRPAQSFVFAENPKGPVSLALLSKDKYGYRCRENSVALTLIRGAYEPDPTPETGRHHISFAIAPIAADSAANSALVRESLAYCHPFTVISGKPASGDLEAQSGLIRPASSSSQGIILSAVKRPEGGGDRLLLRVYEAEGKAGTAIFHLGFAARSAYITDATETKRVGECTLENKGETLSFPVPAYGVRAVIVEIAAKG